MPDGTWFFTASSQNGKGNKLILIKSAVKKQIAAMNSHNIENCYNFQFCSKGYNYRPNVQKPV